MSDGDRCERDHHDARLDVPVAALRPGRRAARRARLVLLAGDEARVELVDVQLPVEPEVLGVGAQEALDVRLGREQCELLVLERAQVLPANLGRKLGLSQVDTPARAGLTKAVADLEHGPRKGSRASRYRCRALLGPAEHAVDHQGERAGDARVEPRPGEQPGRADPRRPVRRCARAPAARASIRSAPRRQGRAPAAHRRTAPAGARCRRAPARWPSRPEWRRSRAARTARLRGWRRYCLTYGRPAAAGPIERPTTPATAISVSRYGSAWKSVPHWFP